MKKLLLVFTWFLYVPVYTQTFQSGVRVWDGNDNESVCAVVVQYDGTVIAGISGYDSDNIAIDPPGSPAFEAASQQIIVAFPNDMSDTLWTVASTNNEYFRLKELELDDYGNIYAYFAGGMSADFELNGVPVAPEYDGHALVKLDPDGNFEWCRYFDGQIFGNMDHLKVINNVAHLMLGFDSGTPIVNPIDSTVLTTSSTEAYIVQVDTGNVVVDFFHLQVPGSTFMVNEYAVSPNNRYAIHAGFNGDVMLNSTLLFESVGNGYKLFEFDFSENFIDSCAFNCNSSTLAYGNNDQLHVAGNYGPAPTSPVLADSFATPGVSSKLLAQLTHDFEIDWMQIYAPPVQPSTGYPEVVDMIVDCNGDIFLTGTANHNTNFGGFIFQESSTLANNWGDLFVLCTDSLGATEWLRYGGGASYDDAGLDLAHDLYGNLFVAGYYSTSCWFGSVYMSYTSGMHDNGMLLKIAGGVETAGIADCINFPPQFATQFVEICEGELFLVGSSVYDTTGIYTDTLVAMLGGDSIVTTYLQVTLPYNITQNISICDGDAWIVGSSVYTLAGNYVDSLQTVAAGCDSVIYTNLTVLLPSDTIQDVTLCDGNQISVGSSVYSLAGNYTDTLVMVSNGCDSIVYTNLSLLPTFEMTMDTTICDGESVVVGPSVYTTAGTYTDVFTMTFTGCDSTIHTNITLVPSPDPGIIQTDSSLFSQEVAATYQWVDCNNGNAPITGETNQQLILTANGSYAVILDNGNCVETSPCFTVDDLGQGENIQRYFAVYPNPTTGNFIISSQREIPAHAIINMINPAGQIVVSITGLQGYTIEINDLNLAPGVYLLELVYGPVMERVQVVIEK